MQNETPNNSTNGKEPTSRRTATILHAAVHGVSAVVLRITIKCVWTLDGSSRLLPAPVCPLILSTWHRPTPCPTGPPRPLQTLAVACPGLTGSSCRKQNCIYNATQIPDPLQTAPGSEHAITHAHVRISMAVVHLVHSHG